MVDETEHMLTQIPGFPRYYINLKGQVWSDKRKKFLYVGKHPDGYNVVTLFNNGRPHDCIIARLLLTTFVRLPLPGELARHLNDHNTDNRLENLAWGTYKQNFADMVRNGHDNFLGNPKLFVLDIISIYSLYAKGFAQVKIAKLYNIKSPQISTILSGKSWKQVYTVWNNKE